MPVVMPIVRIQMPVGPIPIAVAVDVAVSGAAAIGARDHVLAPDQLCQANDSLGDQFGMLDDDGSMCDAAGD